MAEEPRQWQSEQAQVAGYDVSAAPEWIRNVRDLAGFYSIFLRQQKLAPLDVIGFSLGGWIAAEMGAANPDQFEHMVPARLQLEGRHCSDRDAVRRSRCE
jgi:pimeloyl-ACP methyl ester carboxylesterase